MRLRIAASERQVSLALVVVVFLGGLLLGVLHLGANAETLSSSPQARPASIQETTTSYTISLPLVTNQSLRPFARVLRVEGDARPPLQGAILTGTQQTLRIELAAGATGISVTRQASGGPAVDITGLFPGLESTAAATATLALEPGDHVLTVSGMLDGKARSQSAGFFLLEDDTVLLASSPITFPATTDPNVGLPFEDRTVLLAFTGSATQADISGFLAGQGLRPLDVALPFGLLRVQIPEGESPVDAVARLTAQHSPFLAAATLNFVLEDDEAAGERMPTRLVNSYRAAGASGCTTGSTIQGCFDHSGDPDGNAADELRIFRYHFFMDTFAAHRLVERLVTTPTQSAGVAIVDRGLGNGVNTTDIPNGALFHLSTAPLWLNANGVQTRYRNGAAWIAGQPPIGSLVDRASGHGTSVTAAAAGRGTQMLGTGLHVRVRPIRRTSAHFAHSVFAVLGAAWDVQVDVVNTSWGGNLSPAQFTALNLGAYTINVLRAASMPFLDVGLDGNRNTVDGDGSQGNGRFDFVDGNGNNVHDAGEASEPFTDRNGNAAFDAFDALIWVASTGNDNGQNIGTTRLPGAFAPDANPRGLWNPFDGFNQQRELTMLSVSATATNDRIRGPEQLASYSNWGARTSVAAPGDQRILPNRDGNLRRISGTSFAAPTTAGLAGEMIYLDKNLGQALTPPQIIEIIEATADDLGTNQAAVNTTRPNDNPGNGLDPFFGHGRINAWKAILAVANRGVAVESHPALSVTFPSLAGHDIDEAHTRWYGFKVHAPLRGSTVWIDGVQVTDSGATAPGGGAINAYAGVAVDRTIRIGVPGEDPTSGVVPVGGNSDFLITFSIERGDLVKANGVRTLQLRRPGQTAADAPFFVLELNLQDMRDGKVPGVVFDDFVFEITPPDFGDASARPTSLADDGARHLHFQMEYFGRANSTFSLDAVSPEHKVFGVPDPDGITNWSIDLEDLDGYDDGVTFYPLTYKPGATGRVDVQVCVAEAGARYDRGDRDKQIYVNGWLDWDTDGAWEEGPEHVLDGLRLAITGTTAAAWAPLSTSGEHGAAVTLLSSNADCGQYKVTFPVPATVGRGKLQSRWRLDYGENVGRWANTTFTSTATLSLTQGAAFYGEVEDYVIGPDFGDAGKDAPWPTKLSSNGPRHLSFHREWIGPYNGGTPTASREPDACNTGGSDQDGGDNLADGCTSKDQDKLDNFQVSVPKPGIVRVAFDVSSGVQGYGFDGANPGVQTLKSDCTLGAIASTPETPRHQQVHMRYDANNPEERLYVNLYADWDGDGSFETTLLSAPVDPEDFGGDGVYTLGEPFTDANKDGVWNPGESFTDAAGVATRSFVCEFAAPVPPPAGITQWVRLRLDYGENAGQHILRGEPFEEEPLHVPAKDRGGAVWGEVEDTPLVGGAPPIKLSIPDKAKPGEMIHYAITATGNATWDASYPGHLVDALPENVEFVDGSLQCPVGTCAYDPSTRQVTWDGNMDAASTVNVEFDVRVPEVYPLDWPPVTNRIQLFLDKVLYGEAEVTTEVLCLPVKRASVTTVQPGQTYSYTVAIPANGSVTGPVEASMTDPLPPQVQGIHQPVCSTGVCAYDQNTNQVIWSGLLQPGEQAIIEWDVVVNELPPSSCPPEIVNTAQVFDGVEQSQPTSKVTLTCTPP